MLDAVAEKLFTPVLGRFAEAIGGRAKLVALFAFCLGLAAVPLIARHFVFVGLGVFIAGRMLAAIAARAGGSGLDEIYRSVSLAALPFAFALDAPVRALPALVLMFGLAANGAVENKFGRTLIGTTEVLVLFLLAGLLPAWFGLIAYVGGVLCFVAAGVEASRRI